MLCKYILGSFGRSAIISRYVWIKLLPIISHAAVILVTCSGSKKKGDIFVSFCPIEMKVKRLFPMHNNGNGTMRRNVQSALPILASTNMIPQEPKKHCSVQAIAFGGDQSQLAMRGRSMVDNPVKPRLHNSLKIKEWQ